MRKICLLLSVISILFIFCSCSNNKIYEQGIKQTTQNTAELKKDEVSTTMKTTEKKTESIVIKVNDKSFAAQLYDNEMLPLTLDMNELHGNEKYYNLSSLLPMDSSNVGEIDCGDIMLYGNNCLVLFYDSFSTNYSYTKIGYIENPTELAVEVGSGNITISFEK